MTAATDSPAGVGPVDVVVAPAAGPADPAAPHVAPGPEVLLPFPGDQPQELPLLAAAVQGDRPHPVVPAEPGAAPVGEGGAAELPGHQVVSSIESMVGPVATSTPPSTIALGPPATAPK